MDALAGLLPATHLHTLRLQLMHNYIGDVGAQALAGLRNMTLRKFTLVLSNNLEGNGFK
jgi:hypothetical protein